VWKPSSYSDVEAAIGVIVESPELDFKRELSKPTDIAKDIAAMSVQGGVIAYGIDEDAQSVAGEITPIQLHQVPEKIQNIVDTAIWPSPSVAIDVITRQPGDPGGVVVVTVPPSPTAPHYTHDRFPARAGTTTRYLTEREIGALYDQRRAAFAADGERELLADFLEPVGGVGAGLGCGGIGMLRLLVAPLASSDHPLGVRLARPLASAVVAAKEATEPLLPLKYTVAFDLLRDWKPRGTVGWQAGQTFDTYERLRQGRTSAVVCTHDLVMSFYATIELSGEDGKGRCAYEHLWAAETIAFLSIAGHFFQQIPTTALLRAELGLQGLENAVSYAASEGLAFNPDQPRATDGYRERTQTSSAELVNEPTTVASRLLDRFFVSFVPEHMDTFVRLRSTF
jgi:Putative DNA-binding domain